MEGIFVGDDLCVVPLYAENFALQRLQCAWPFGSRMALASGGAYGDIVVRENL
jgi:hypothetical protein